MRPGSIGWGGRIALAAALGLCPTLAMAQVPADQKANARIINDMIDVLRHTRAAPSQACLSALQEMHTTESQIKQLGGSENDVQTTPTSAADDAEQSELAIARDVLASDIETTRSACLGDARGLCAAATDPVTRKACGAMDRDLNAPPGRDRSDPADRG